MFDGEWMTCIICGRRERSNPERDSGWRAITANDDPAYYVCPLEMPPGGAGEDKFSLAYTVVMHTIYALRAGRKPEDSPVLGRWIRARRSGAIPFYSSEALIQYLPNSIRN